MRGGLMEIRTSANTSLQVAMRKATVRGCSAAATFSSNDCSPC